MKHKWYTRYIQAGRATTRVAPTLQRSVLPGLCRVGATLVVALLLVQFIKPTGAIGTAKAQQAVAGRIQRAQSTTAVNATIYLARDYLASMFQSHISADVPISFNNDMMKKISKLPKQDQGWALAMAHIILQPSATLESLTPQAGGLGMSLRLSFYPGDPKPINSNMLISFNVLDSSTVQVNAQPLNGSAALINAGPLSTFQIPIGQLNSISSTPGCGNSALALNLKFPVALGSAQASAQAVSRGQTQNLTAKSATQSQTTNNSTNAASAYIEIPASSLAQMGNTIGSLPVGNGLTAQNVRLGVSGRDLTITTDIFWNSIPLGTAVTTVAPTASNGNIVVHVLSTTFTVLWIITFPMNSYNAQIEHTLNAKLGNALAGKFNVTAAGIGPMNGLPCAASDSLVLAGSANIGA